MGTKVSYDEIDNLFDDLELRNIHDLKIENAHLGFYGYLIIAMSCFCGSLYLYAAFISKLLPDTGAVVLDMIKNDYYICYLIPLIIPPTYAVIYLNWLSIRHFEQN